MRNKIANLLLFLLCFVFLTKPVFAGFGVSPAEISNDHLKPGSKFDGEIVLSRSDANEQLKVVVETDLGEAENWFQFSPGKNFIFPTGQQRFTLKYSVNVPTNASLKDYKGVLRIKASSVEDKNSGVSIVKGARMEVNLVTTSIDINLLNIKGLKIADIQGNNPIKLTINLENNGNTNAAPSKVSLEIQSLNQQTIETQEVTNLEKIPANTTKDITAEFKNNLNSGEYFGIVKVYLGDKLLHTDRLVFKVIGNSITENKAKKSFLSKIITTIKNNKVETAAAIFIPLIPIAVGLSIYKFGVFLFLKRFFLIGTIIYTAVGIFLTSFYHFKWKPANFAQPNDVGSVKGETIEITPTLIPKIPKNETNLNINQPTGYSIYRNPDLNSPIVYTAKEDEKFQVLNENENWYQVLIKNGSGGWLPKKSVKQSN